MSLTFDSARIPNPHLTKDHLAWRDALRRFIDKEIMPYAEDWDEAGHIPIELWPRAAEVGLLGAGYPEQYGGMETDSWHNWIINEELSRVGVGGLSASLMVHGIGLPPVINWGTEEMKAEIAPPVLRGESWISLGITEPGGGSDVASLKTTAVRDGDHYVINGQKTWTTLAQYADWGFFLCRTDPDADKPQEGISFILVDMKTPGVEVKPIKLLDGGYEVNETWLTDVRVPVENLVGEENKGWTYAKFLLAHERSGIAGVARSKRGVEKLREIAANETLNGEPLIEDFDFARKVSQLEIDLAALEITELRTLAGEQAGKGPGPESSILKIKGTEIQQRLTELTLEAVGSYSAPYYGSIANDTGSNEYPIGPEYAHHSAATYFNMRKTSIYGGSNEIQRNIITKMILGL